MTAIKLILCLILSAAPCRAALSILIKPGTVGDTTVFTFTQTSPSPILNVSGIAGFVMGISIPNSMFNIPDFGPGSSSDITGDLGFSLAAVTENYSGVTYILNGLHISADPARVSFLGFGSTYFVPAGASFLQFEFGAAGLQESSISIHALNPGVHTIEDPLFGTVTVTIIPEPGSALLAGMGACALFIRRRARPGSPGKINLCQKFHLQIQTGQSSIPP